jgi:hypothetical protein
VGNISNTLSFEGDSLENCCEMVDMPLGSSLAALLISLVTFILIAWRSSSKSTPYPLPPGPKGEPIIGHMRIVPQENPQLYYQRLSKEYSMCLAHFCKCKSIFNITSPCARFGYSLLQAVEYSCRGFEYCQSCR